MKINLTFRDIRLIELLLEEHGLANSASVKIPESFKEMEFEHYDVENLKVSILKQIDEGGWGDD